MAKQKNSNKVESTEKVLYEEIKALLAHLIEIVERIDKRISGGF